MNRSQLQRSLLDLGIEPAAFSMDTPKEQTWCIDTDTDGCWRAYWLERGNLNHLVKFATEKDACFWLLGRLGYSASLESARLQGETKRRAGWTTVQKFIAYAIVGSGILHILVLGADAVGHVPDWLSGTLWTWEHWGPVSDQRPELVISGFAFWSTIGSFAVPLIILGGLIAWLANRNVVIPKSVGFALLGWGLVATVLMPPSGFPLFIFVAAALCWWRSKAATSP